MKKEKFIEIITKIENYDSEIERWSDFGLSIFENDICQLPWVIINAFLEELFTKEQVDWIYWYLFERVDLNGNISKCWDENGNEIIIKNPEDLWNFLF